MNQNSPTYRSELSKLAAAAWSTVSPIWCFLPNGQRMFETSIREARRPRAAYFAATPILMPAGFSPDLNEFVSEGNANWGWGMAQEAGNAKPRRKPWGEWAAPNGLNKLGGSEENATGAATRDNAASGKSGQERARAHHGNTGRQTHGEGPMRRMASGWLHDGPWGQAHLRQGAGAGLRRSRTDSPGFARCMHAGMQAC